MFYINKGGIKKLKIRKDLFEIKKGNMKREKKGKEWKNYKKLPFFIAIVIYLLIQTYLVLLHPSLGGKALNVTFLNTFVLVNKMPTLNSSIIAYNYKYEQNYETRFDNKNNFVDTTGDSWTGPTAGVKLQFYNEGFEDPS